MTQNFPDNTLYEMDNLDVLRGMNSNTVDLIATDPPFNTKRNRSGSAGFYVDNWKWGDTSLLPDQWKWNEVHPKWLEEIKDNHTALYHAIDAAKHCQGEDTAAFLCFLSVRLIEMHRVLKGTGSIYLHCDHAANAYIRMAMDAIFGKNNFRNEIVWKRTNAPTASPKKLGTVHDTIFLYTKSGKTRLNPVFIPYTQEYINEHYKHQDSTGKYQITPLTAQGIRHGYSGKPWRGVDVTTKRLHWVCPTSLPENLKIPESWHNMNTLEKLDWLDFNNMIYWPKRGKMPRFKRYLSTSKGMRLSDTIVDIPGLQGSSTERTGSPDQKPLNLYKRIIKAGSNEEDLVLDPFCGCATTIIAARELNRRWIGIDRRPDARYHVITRLMGIEPKERKRLEKYGTDKEWLNRQMQPYEMHYQTEPPIRTDTDEQNSPKLAHVYPIESEHRLSHAEMHDILINEFGLKCWGCNFSPPDKRYLQLDHIIPKIDGGTNDIDNRALLCQPCNLKKSSKMSLSALRKQNERDEHIQPNPPIDLKAALVWTRNYLIQTIRETPHQFNLNRF